MKRRVIVITAIAVCAVAVLGIAGPSSGAAGGSPPSIALQGPSDPPPGGITDSFGQCVVSGALCLWHDGAYSGTFWSFSSGNWDTWFYVGSAANDQASSLYNNRSRISYVSKDDPPSAQTVCLPPQFAVQHLSNFVWPDGSNMNDSISAYNRLSAETC